MSTIRDTAIYFAKQAFSNMQMTGHWSPRLTRHEQAGCYRYWHTGKQGDEYVVVLRHAADGSLGGAVDAKLTKEANR